MTKKIVPSGSREIEGFAQATVVEPTGESPLTTHAVYLFNDCLHARKKVSEACLKGDPDTYFPENREREVKDVALTTEAAKVFNCVEWLANFELRTRGIAPIAELPANADVKEPLKIWELPSISKDVPSAVIRKHSVLGTTTVSDGIRKTSVGNTVYTLYIEDTTGLIGMELTEEVSTGKREFTLSRYEEIGLKDVRALEIDISTAEKIILLSGKNSGVSFDPFESDDKPYFQLYQIEHAVMGGRALAVATSFARHYSRDIVFKQ
jgi:hypothetical protein